MNVKIQNNGGIIMDRQDFNQLMKKLDIKDRSVEQIYDNETGIPSNLLILTLDKPVKMAIDRRCGFCSRVCNMLIYQSTTQILSFATDFDVFLEDKLRNINKVEWEAIKH